MEILDCLLDTTIQNAERVHDYVQLSFDNSAILNIYCWFRVDGTDQDISKVVGLKVREVLNVPYGMFLKFYADQQIEIRYNDEDYSGPEALELIDPSGQIIVWP